MGKKIGDMTADEANAAIRRAAAQFNVELQRDAPAIGRALEDNMTLEYQRDEQRSAEAQAGSDSTVIDTQTRMRAPRNRAEMRERFEMFG